jgi:hypothetical protein
LQPWSRPELKVFDLRLAETGTFSNADGDSNAS